jgi:CheY-like chemotaxis protein
VRKVKKLSAGAAQQRPIMVVDDDVTVAEIIACFLGEEGYPVVVAHDGVEAMKSLVTCQPRIILLDMQMPTMDGRAFVAAYRKRPAPHAPIVVMSAAYDSRLWAAGVGADDYIAKPFDLYHVLDVVRRYAR